MMCALVTGGQTCALPIGAHCRATRDSAPGAGGRGRRARGGAPPVRKSVALGKSDSARVDLGGRLILKNAASINKIIQELLKNTHHITEPHHPDATTSYTHSQQLNNTL